MTTEATMETVFTFDESQARAYVPNPLFAKHAVLVWDGADYSLSWGEQHFDGPHIRVLGDQPYGCALKEFFTTHVPVPEKPDHYVKNARITAVRVTEETVLETVVDGTIEARSTVPAGAYVIRNPGGEMYYNSREEFDRRYIPDRQAAQEQLAGFLSVVTGPDRVTAADLAELRAEIAELQVAKDDERSTS